MVSTRRLNQAEQAAPNVWLRADGGFIFADARNAVTLAAAIVRQVSMLQSTTPRRVIRSSQASSRASTGFMIIVPRNPSPARSFPLLSAIRWINRRRDRPERCLQTGKRCFTNRARAPRSALPARCLVSRPNTVADRFHDLRVIGEPFLRTVRNQGEEATRLRRNEGYSGLFVAIDNRE
jgi:hypothetical protein